MLIRAAILLGLVVTGVSIAATATGASGDCPPGTGPTPVPGGGVICIEVTEPGSPPGLGGGESDGGGGSDGGGCRRTDGSPVACVSDWGVWVDAHQCWAHPVNVPPDDPAWEGRTDGEVWMCALIDDSSPEVLFWVPPGGPAGGPPDPGTLAQSALGQLPLTIADVQMAPSYPDPAVVGIENWLWLPESQWQPLTKTVRTGGTAVTVVAKPDRVVWDMGPGETTCFDAGRPWTNGMGDDAMTRCGYTYDKTSEGQPKGVFDVTATIRYAVDWTCSGVCTSTAGSLGLVDAPAGSATVRVVQRQTVVVR